MPPNVLLLLIAALESTLSACASVTELVGTPIGVLDALFTVYRNGQLVESFEGDLIKSGGVAPYASTATSGTPRVAFDNLSVWTAIGTE